ncbi:MAG: SRPBCC domain-containing protein [Acidobacteriota bacterium]
MNDAQEGKSLSLQLRRILQASPERVFRAWTEPRELEQWFSATDKHQVRVPELEAREGGRYRIEYRTPEGVMHIMVGTYRLVQPPEKLVFTWRFEKGGAGDTETLVTLEMRSHGSGTELVLTHEQFPDADVMQKHRDGWSGHLDRFVEHVNRNV